MTAWLMDLSAGAPPWLLPVLLLLLPLTLAMLYKKSGTRRVKSSEGLAATPDSHQRRRPHKSPPRAPVANRYNRDRQHGPSRTADVLPVALSSRFDTMAENDNDGSDWKPNHDASNDEDNERSLHPTSDASAAAPEQGSEHSEAEAEVEMEPVVAQANMQQTPPDATASDCHDSSPPQTPPQTPRSHRRPFSVEEDENILEYRRQGLAWSELAAKMPGRSAPSLQARYRTHLRVVARTSLTVAQYHAYDFVDEARQGRQHWSPPNRRAVLALSDRGAPRKPAPDKCRRAQLAA